MPAREAITKCAIDEYEFALIPMDAVGVTMYRVKKHNIIVINAGYMPFNLLHILVWANNHPATYMK